MFCSQKCLDYADKHYHQYECIVIDALRIFFCDNFLLAIRSFYITYTICGSMEELIKFMCTDQKFYSVFDFDFKSTNIDRNYIKMVDSLTGSTTFKPNLVMKILNHIFVRHPKMKNIWKSPKYRKFIDIFIERVMCKSMKNGYYSCWWSVQNHVDPLASIFKKCVKCQCNGIHRHNSGIALLPFTSLIELSCAPNCILIPVDNKFVVLTIRPIQANEKLTICRW